MAPHRHRVAAPVTTRETTMKKYSSGAVAVKGSKTPSPRKNRIREPYFSNIRRETNRPGIASRMRITPTPRSSSPASASPPPRNMRPAKRRTRHPNGVWEKAFSRLSSHCLAFAIKGRSRRRQVHLQFERRLLPRRVARKHPQAKTFQFVRERRLRNPGG